VRVVSGTFDGSWFPLFVIDEAGARWSRMMDFCNGWRCGAQICEQAHGDG